MKTLQELHLQKPEHFAVLINSLAKVNKSTLEIEQFKQNAAEQKRQLEAELAKQNNDGGLSPETITKIQEALNLM